MNEAAAQARSRLAALGRGDDHDLDPAESALLLAALSRSRRSGGPEVDACLALLDAMAGELRDMAGSNCGDAEGLGLHLFRLISQRHRFLADERDEEELGDLDLLTVLERRRGGNEALGLIALAVARRAGFEADCLGFPAHLLLRVGHPDGGRAIFDPSGGGRALSAADLRAMIKAAAGLDAELEPAHYTAISNRDLLLRLGNAAKLRLLRLGHVERALAMVEALLLLAPEAGLLWREAGLMHMRLDHTIQAISALEQFVSRAPNAQARARTLALLAELKRRLH